MAVSDILAIRSKGPKRTAFCSGLGDGYFDRPTFPADLFIATRQPGLAPALLEKLHNQLPASPGRASTGSIICSAGCALGVYLSLKGRDALLYHSLELIVVDIGESEV